MSQPVVPLWVAVAVIVLSAMDSAALAYTDPGFTIQPVVRFALFIINVGLISLAAALNIKRAES